MADDNDPEGPEPRTRLDLQPQSFTNAWTKVRPALELVELLLPEQHQGLHLAVQALMVIGDLMVVSFARPHH